MATKPNTYIDGNSVNSPFITLQQIAECESEDQLRDWMSAAQDVADAIKIEVETIRELGVEIHANNLGRKIGALKSNKMTMHWCQRRLKEIGAVESDAERLGQTIHRLNQTLEQQRKEIAALHDALKSARSQVAA